MKKTTQPNPITPPRNERTKATSVKKNAGGSALTKANTPAKTSRLPFTPRAPFTLSTIPQSSFTASTSVVYPCVSRWCDASSTVQTRSTVGLKP